MWKTLKKHTFSLILICFILLISALCLFSGINLKAFKEQFKIIQPLLTVSSLLVVLGKDIFSIDEETFKRLTERTHIFYGQTRSWISLVWLSIMCVFAYAFIDVPCLLKLSLISLSTVVFMLFMLAISLGSVLAFKPAFEGVDITRREIAINNDIQNIPGIEPF